MNAAEVQQGVGQMLKKGEKTGPKYTEIRIAYCSF
jgi:hypothetical protein